MASDEVGVELGTETVDRCKAALQRAEELQVARTTAVVEGSLLSLSLSFSLSLSL